MHSGDLRFRQKNIFNLLNNSNLFAIFVFDISKINV